MPEAFEALSPPRLLEAAALFTAFVGALFVGSLVLPGPLVEGAPGPDGTRPRYRLNGLVLFLLAVAGVVAGSGLPGWRLSGLPERFVALLVMANLFALGLSGLLLLHGLRRGAGSGAAAGGCRGGPLRLLRDFFYGVEANPRWWGLDLKLFSYRPSLIGLGLINLSFAAVQLETYGEISIRMWLYQLFYGAYLANYFQFEHGMLFTWDITTERFGWGLIWGDYVLVPFFYSLPGWFLVHSREPLPSVALVGLLGLYMFGFLLFRGANQQKHHYRLDPTTRIWGRPAESLGGRLLVSGWWGIGRKLNYSGELCLYWAWTLLCGFGSLVPYLLPLWLTALLAHRAERDDKRCRAKYGELWTAYCRRARFRMIPFVY